MTDTTTKPLTIGTRTNKGWIVDIDRAHHTAALENAYIVAPGETYHEALEAPYAVQRTYTCWSLEAI